MSERVEIGRVCFKGPHIALHGNSDYGACGSKYYATVYVSVELDHPNPQGEDFTAEDAAQAIQREVAAAEAHQWCGYDDSKEAADDVS